MLSTYLAIRGALLTHHIDNDCSSEYERVKLMFRQSFVTRVVERSVLTHPDVLPTVDLDELDTALETMAESARRRCVAAATTVVFALLWPLSAWALPVGVLTWHAVKRATARHEAARINQMCRAAGWDVQTLLDELPEQLTQLKIEASRGPSVGLHRAAVGRPLQLPAAPG